MMRLRSSLISVALLSTLCYAQTPVSFKRTYTEGMKETYAVTSDMDMSMDFMGEASKSNIKSTSDMIYTYSKIQSDGSATLDFLTTNGKSVTVSDPADETDGEEKDEDSKGTSKIDVFGNQTEVKLDKKPGEEDPEADPISDSLNSLMSGPNGASFLPTKPVMPGDTWTVPLEIDEKESLFEKGAVATGKFVGEKDYKGQMVWIIEATMSPKFDLDSKDLLEKSANPGEELDIKMEGGIVGKTVYFVRKSDNKVLLQTNELKMNCSMDFAGLVMKLEMGGTINIEAKD